MKNGIYGCACCSPEFGLIFKNNWQVNAMQARAHEGSTDIASFLAPSMMNRRAFVKGSLATVAAAMVLSSTGCSGKSAAQTTVFTGGTILTVDEKFSEAEAIAISGNRIVAVGKDAEVRKAAGADAEVVDLGGKVMLPGFIDAHTHVVAGSVVDSVMEYVGMARFGTVAEVLDQLKAIAASKPPGEWIVVRNFDPAVQEGPDSLTFEELDPVSTDHPIFVFNASGHLAYANSKAFEVAGIPEDVENPPGAEFVRDENGKLNGIMKNNVAFLQVLGKYPALAEADPSEALLGLLGKWTEHGLTTVSELALGGLSQSPADIDVMFGAARSGRLPARIRASDPITPTATAAAWPTCRRRN
jgi:predicted amidohydrolase YtcJ